MKLKQNQKGFTLIEILLVVTILGFMLAVIIPRGLRTSTDAKYNLLRQSSTELAAYANQWVEMNILAQDADSTATAFSYYRSLTDPDGTALPSTIRAAWIADISRSNWNDNAPVRIAVKGRTMSGNLDSRPEAAIESLIDPAMVPRNPFNGANVFLSVNQPTAVPIPGAIACSRSVDKSLGTSYQYIALIFQGTDSTTADADPTTLGVDFHAGMDDSSIKGLRNGVLVARTQ